MSVGRTRFLLFVAPTRPPPLRVQCACAPPQQQQQPLSVTARRSHAIRSARARYEIILAFTISVSFTRRPALQPRHYHRGNSHSTTSPLHVFFVPYRRSPTSSVQSKIHPCTMTFEEAVDKVKNLNKTPNDNDLLELYGLFKQATVGDVNTAKPGFLDFKGKAKWEAWNGRKGLSNDEAKKKYVEIVDKLVEEIGLKI